MPRRVSRTAATVHGLTGNGPSRARHAAVAGRRLRALVARLHSCLDALSPGAAHLLGLRAGVLGRAALSADGAARALGVTAAREGRLERRALIALRAAASNGCGASGSGSAPSPGSAGVPVPGAARTTHRAAVRRRGVTRSDRSGVAPAARRAPTTAESTSSPTGTPSWALIVALAALALAGGFALQRAYRGPGQMAALAVGPAPAVPPPATLPAPAPRPAPAAPPAPAARPAPAALPGSRRWGRHRAELAAVAITAIAGGAARLASQARRRSARRR